MLDINILLRMKASSGFIPAIVASFASEVVHEPKVVLQTKRRFPTASIDDEDKAARAGGGMAYQTRRKLSARRGTAPNRSESSTSKGSY